MKKSVIILEMYEALKTEQGLRKEDFTERENGLSVSAFRRYIADIKEFLHPQQKLVYSRKESVYRAVKK